MRPLTKREIVLELRRIHVDSHVNVMDLDCPFCQRKRDNAERLIASFHEGPLLEIVQRHKENWERLGAQIANRINGHNLPSTLVSEVLTSWIAMRVDLPDTPEDYLDHPLVLDLFEQQKNEDSE